MLECPAAEQLSKRMSVDVRQRSTSVVSTFNSCHVTGLPPREWLTGKFGAQPPDAGKIPVDMQAWSKLPQNVPDIVHSGERPIPAARPQPDSATAPLPHECERVKSSPADEDFIESASSPAACSDCSDFYADCRDCSSSVSAQSPDDGSHCFDEGELSRHSSLCRKWALPLHPHLLLHPALLAFWVHGYPTSAGCISVIG